MATTYQHEQRFFVSSEGYVKYNITPEFGTYIAPGETVKITGVAKCSIHPIKCIEVMTYSNGTQKHVYIAKEIKKGYEGSFEVEFPMWNLSESWGTGRVRNAPITFTLYSVSDPALGGGDETIDSTGNQAISFLQYRINISKRNAEFERYSQDIIGTQTVYHKNDEGTKAIGSLGISISDTMSTTRSAIDITSATVRITNSGNSTIETINIPSSVLSAALTENGYVETQPSLFSSIDFDTRYDYTLLFTLGDSYNTYSFSLLIAKAFANVHMSGCSTGGVAFGKFSAATENNPMFECEYPAYFNDGIFVNDIKDGDTLTLTGGTFFGYVTDSTKKIVFNVPIAKSLRGVTSASITALTASIANNGGYAITSGPVTGGSSYMGTGITRTIRLFPDLNVIEVTLEKSSAWDLTNNNCVNVRNETMSFTFTVT